MSEEKKKESFTFSDKIKNSKPAPSKSFANRASSKIGSDGKPRQTLFERTKRDAPFFIAALVALLLLPFLYKYSGSVDEEPTMVTPGYEDSAFNPERSGFDIGGDPEGQIAQLSGRDSMSLILPYGGAKATEEELDEEDYSRSAYAGEGSSSSHSLDEQDEEENTTNIYKYRKKAPAATRAAFKRAATKINRLPNAGRAGANGSKLGVGMWGGGLKSAANKVRGKAPQSAPKPVSLQPLQAAGKPSRSYFGQGPAREAARSKDAMSKGNAMQALMDAQMKPVEPGKIGGILGGDFGGPGGGNGELKREFAFNGKEPWWWDMMKQQAMMEWQKKFEYKWGWINWATDLAKNILGGILNCLLTGNDDGSMGHMFGAIEGSGKKDECCGMDEDKFKGAAPGVEFSEKACKGWVTAHPEVKCSTKWVSGHKAATSMGAFGARMDCLTNGLWAARKGRKASEGVVTEVNDCAAFYQTGYYKAQVGGKKRTVYHYVVGIPFDKVDAFFNSNATNDTRYNMLQIGYFAKGDSFVVDSTLAQQEINKRKFVPLFIESVAIKNRKVNKKTSNKKYKYEMEEVADDEEALVHEWVERIGKKETTHGMFYKDFIQGLNKRGGGVVVTTDRNDPAATLMSAKGSKKGKSWNTGARCAYPMAFVSCRNNALYAQSKEIGEGTVVRGTPAAFLKLPNLATNKAVLSQVQLNKLTPHFQVMYEIQGEDQNPSTGLSTSTDKGTGRMYFANIHPSNEGYDDPNITNDGGINFQPTDATYTVKVEGKGEEELKTIVGEKNEKEARAVITWTVRQIYNPEEPWAIAGAIADGKGGGRSIAGEKGGTGAKAPGQIVSEATCVYFDDGGYNEVIHLPACKEGEEKYNPYPDQPGVCQMVKVCHDGKWSDWTKNMKDPDCGNQPLRLRTPSPDGETEVCLYSRIVRIPKKNAILVPDTRDCTTQPSRVVDNPNWEGCKITEDNGLLLPLDDETREYFKKAKVKFDEDQTNKANHVTLKLEAEETLTVSHLVDAIMIDPNNGTVPANTVCLLGKTIGSRAKDPGPDERAKDMDNLFGAFVAYTGMDAASYPSQGTHFPDGHVIRHDPRFKYGSDYYWGGYVDQRNRAEYVRQIQNSSIWGGLPLRELLRQPLTTKNGDERYLVDSDSNNRRTFHTRYADWTNLNPCTYEKGKTVQQSKVLEYITSLCKYGTQNKPKATWKTRPGKTTDHGQYNATKTNQAPNSYRNGAVISR